MNKEHSPGRLRRTGEILRAVFRVRSVKGPEKLRAVIEELGPVYVKLGQMLSGSSRLIPEEYRAELASLREHVTPLPPPDVRNVIKAELGAEPEKVFSDFDYTPAGSASVAQVHPAVLHTGERVAVKVLRPGAYEMVRMDVSILRRLSGLLKRTKLGAVADFNAVLDELWDAAQTELDMRMEAENLRTFALANAGIADAASPKLFPEYTTRGVMTMEYVDGAAADDAEAIASRGVDAGHLCERLYMSCAAQIFVSGVFHADPHTGNLRLREDGLCWLDFGLVGSISEADRAALKRGVKAVVFGDAEAVADVLLCMGASGEAADRERLASEIADILERCRTVQLARLDIESLARAFVSAASDCGVVMPAGVALLTRGVAALGGTLTLLDPELDAVTALSKVASAYLSDRKKDKK